MSIETKCPHCDHIIIIPDSVTHYVCICGKEFKIVFVKDNNHGKRIKFTKEEGSKES